MWERVRADLPQRHLHFFYFAGDGAHFDLEADAVGIDDIEFVAGRPVRIEFVLDFFDLARINAGRDGDGVLLVNQSSITTPHGPSPTAILAVTELLLVSMTET